jgi:hypothetical protein
LSYFFVALYLIDFVCDGTLKLSILVSTTYTRMTERVGSAVTITIHIQLMLGSNPDLYIGYADWGFSGFSSRQIPEQYFD